MTQAGDASDRSGRPASLLRLAREQRGWSQATAMRHFAAAVTRLGEHPPTGASLKRMFAFWESSKRTVTVAAYQQAFVTIYRSPPEALGFAPVDDSGRIEEVRNSGFELYDIDTGLVALFESQTQNLRMLDRRLGTAA